VPNGRAHNPLVTHIFTADPNATVYGDRVYLYVSHDVDGQDDYDMVDYRGFSSDDMVNWQDHGVLIHADSLPWATNLYAPGACAKNGKYYLYMPNGGSSIGVAVSDDPGGPFVDPIGDALVTKNYPNSNVPWLFDPACFVDDDGQGYLYFGGGNDGGQNARVIRLNDDMISLKDASATTITTTAFFEASFMHKRDGVYYFSYSSDFSTDHGAALEYLTSDNPMTNFAYKGKFLPNSNINEGNNNHGSIIEFQDKTYVFYHARKLEQELGVNKVNNRSVALQEITYGANGALNQITMSTEDFTVTQLKCLDGFAEVQAETLAGEHGIEVEGKAGETVSVAQISEGDWVGYSQVDFRNGATKLVLKVASAQGAGNIDVRIDNCLTGEDGTAIGTCTVAATGGATTFDTLTCDITGPAGPHDLCLHFGDNPSFAIDSWHIE
jgi:arabinoxylan arabinofuranohydrolase